MNQTPPSGHDWDETDVVRTARTKASVEVTKKESGTDPVELDAAAEAAARVEAESRTVIGRYRVVRIIGFGGFGTVYLAEDDKLKRSVSIKVPRRTRVNSAIDVQQYITEAQTVAKLEHPHIVPVYDFGQLPEGICYVVSKYIDGRTLDDQMKEQQFSFEEIIDVVATIANTLQFVHDNGIVHRDIKPSNILRDKSGHLFVADFGLALQDSDAGPIGTAIGTPAYMSPEQARGEGHLVKAPSDIFSMGVVLYEMLTGVRPFTGENVNELLFRISNQEPRPIRHINSQLPRELELVCQKALAKKVSDRYQSATELVADLKACREKDFSSVRTVVPERGPATESNATRTEETNRIQIVPKGLRSYETHDAYFFQKMLPGPYDIEGCPESVRFWKNRIDPDCRTEPFRVGVIYGTSGCGKSSFIRAGLAPMLDQGVVVCMINASPARTAENLAASLAKQLPEMSGVVADNAPLSKRIAAIRRTRDWPEGRKVLIVVDQFEQWLDNATAEERNELILALRQCDGERLQTILLVRDDFWLAVSRLMSELDVPMVPSENLALIDLFDKPHARRVLTMLGRAYQRLSENDADMKKEQRQFIAEAVDLLAEEDRIVPVRLALFTEMVKSLDWTRNTLRELGGIDGIGERFLYKCFDAPTAKKELQVHQKAAIATLQALLPEAGVIRGRTLTRTELMQASGYADQPLQFNQLMQNLDGNLRLITSVESESADAVKVTDSTTGADSESRYQLTHDFLVPAVRKWVTRRQRSTMSGRAELALAERTQSWAANPNKRQLPSFPEWVYFKCLTSRSGKSDAQTRMMKQASRRYGFASAAAILTLCLAVSGGGRDSQSDASHRAV